MASGSGSVANRVITDEDGSMHCPECGAILNDERSDKHLRMFNAFLQYVVKHWPSYSPDGRYIADQRPNNKEHLRALMLIRVGHCEPEHVIEAHAQSEMEWAIKTANALMAAERRAGRYGVTTISEGGIVVRRPASIAMSGKNKISEKKFCQITDEVFAIIAMETGIVLDVWKRSGKKA